MITLIFIKKLGIYKIMRNTVQHHDFIKSQILSKRTLIQLYLVSIHVQNTMFLREEEGRARSAGMKNPLIYRAARGPSQWSNTIVCSSSATPFKNEPTYVIFLFASTLLPCMQLRAASCIVVSIIKLSFESGNHHIIILKSTGFQFLSFT